jgi:redox-sensitive bicupin YhaK (pirin superfamily)
MKNNSQVLYARGIANVTDLVPMHSDSIRQAGAAIPPGDWAAHDPFLSMMNDRFKKGAFGPHPHRGIETITYILDGSLSHQDSRGGRGVLTAGDAQWMTAGGGVEHLEDPVDDKPVQVLQLWLNLSATDKLTPPRYQDLRGDRMPVRHESGAEVRVFSGASGDVRGPALNHVPVTMVELRLDAGATIAQELPGSYNGFVYVIDGEGRFGRDGVAAGSHQTLWLERTPAGNPTTLSVTAITPIRVLLFAGEPLHEPVVAYGPFVMNTERQIEEAYADYRAGHFGR